MSIGFGHQRAGHVMTDYEMEQRIGHPLRSITEVARDKKVFALALTGTSAQDLSEAFKITVPKVQSILHEYRYDPDMIALSEKLNAAARASRATLRSVETRRKPASKVLDSHILDALLAAMHSTGFGVDMTEGEYNAWRNQNSPLSPGTRTIRRRFGWNRSKHLAQGINLPEGNFANVVDNVA